MGYKYFRDIYIRYLRNFLAKDEMTATTFDKFMALAYAVRSELVPHWISTQRSYIGKRRLYILSMEHMLGKSLQKNMTNLGIEEAFAAAVNSFGISIKDLFDKDNELNLGNSGKSRVVACLLESMATLGMPAMAYGMRYDYGQFRQEIKNGMQKECPNDCLHKGHPWEIIRSEYIGMVKFAGECVRVDESLPLGPYEWKGAEEVYAMPYDTPLVGHKNDVINTLRLWSAWASEEFLPDYMYHNDYVRACEEKSLSGRITKVLFPDEDVKRAHDMRIKQQYFFVSASIQDIVRRHKRNGNSIQTLDSKVAIHLSGSSCALAIPEMMRVLVDLEGIEWTQAWEMTTKIFSYTSSATHRDYTETWPVYKIGQLMPRIMQIIFDINLEHLDQVRSQCGDNVELLRNLSLIEEGEVKRIRFADMAALGSNSISGVSAAHTEFLKSHVFPVYHAHYPKKFSCKSNGVSHRHWLYGANRPLAALITRVIGDGWIRHPEELEKFEAFVSNTGVLKDFHNVKNLAKNRLCEAMKEKHGIVVDSTMLFDMHSRSFHTLKRQALHILYILNNYLKIKNGKAPVCRRAFIFAGKASPSDFLAKQIIHLVNVVADIVNGDPDAKDLMKVVFVPNFGVSWAELFVPAANLSEQISTVTNEPAGTFAMKYSFNGALTLASRCGTNIELIKSLGEENIFAFGKTTEEIIAVNSHYNPGKIIEEDERLREIFALLESSLHSVPEGYALYPLLSSLRDSDRSFVLTDFADYINKQDKADELYNDRAVWDSKCLRNISKMGWFSTDRLVKEFASDIWKITQG
ncbi:MAG: glycogen/starch/alpha-glucan family phosphorylase [Chitinispirillales bacterium]|jgi:starch phosphorylase|nr:glycogen/starch/alpha-glucan family phosphorylase [Chitinispirillales bacterium]